MDFTMYADGKTLCTAFLQKAIDDTPAGGHLVIPAGTYLTGSLFLHSDMTFELAEGAVLLGVQDEAAYPRVPHRGAGAEDKMAPAALLNGLHCENLTVCGKGAVDGHGEYWWYKFWGPPEDNHKGGMIAQYPSNLRWAVDIDCPRPRNYTFGYCKNLVLKDFQSLRSACWNLHVYYSEDVLIDGVVIGDNLGPSTDGIDIDSCNRVVVRNCNLSAHDDGICLKSGRVPDPVLKNRPCENVEIYNCHLSAPTEGITLGSETAGDIRNVYIHDCTFDGARNGFRIKSARNRGGIIENIVVKNLTMRNVRYAFSFQLDWFPQYSYCKVPDDYTGPIKDHWKILLKPIPLELGLPLLRNVTIENVTTTVDEDYTKSVLQFLPSGYKLDSSIYTQNPPVLFELNADPSKPMQDITLRNVNLDSRCLGSISGVKNLKLENVTLSVSE